MKLMYFVATLLGLSSLSYANSIINDFLYLNNKNHYEHSDLRLKDGTLEYIEKIRVDSQYSQDEQHDAQESLSIRFYPKDVESYNLEKKNFINQQSHLNTNMDKENILLQEQNYKLLVSAKFQKKLIMFLDKTIALYQNQLNVKERLMDDKFYIESIFFMKQKVQILTLKREKQVQLYRSIIENMILTLNGKYQFGELESAVENYRLMDSSNIIGKIDSSNFHKIRKSNIDTQLNNEKVDLIHENLRIEEKKEEFRFDFLEAGYKNKETQGNSFSIGLGIDLPVKGTNKIKIFKDKLTLVELNQKDKITNELYLFEAKRLSEESKTLYSYENGLRKILEDDTFYTLYSKKEDADPRFLLEVQEKNLNSEEELLMVQEKLYQSYIKLLELCHGFNNTTLSPNYDNVREL